MFNFTKLLTSAIIFTLLLSLCGCTKYTATCSHPDALQNSEVHTAAEKEIFDLTEQFSPVDISKLQESEVIEVGSSPSFMTSFRTLDEITKKSEYIVRGSAEKVYYTAIDGITYTVVDFLVTESLKGEIENNSLITVLFLGGYISMDEHIKSRGNADKFSGIPKEKWSTTFVKRTVEGAPLPQEKENYLLCLGKNKGFNGSYYPHNEYEGVFQKTGETYERYLPEGYSGEKVDVPAEYSYTKTFKLTDLKTEIEKIEKTGNN